MLLAVAGREGVKKHPLGMIGGDCLLHCEGLREKSLDFGTIFEKSAVKLLIFLNNCGILCRLNRAGVVEWQTRRTQNPM